MECRSTMTLTASRCEYSRTPRIKNNACKYLTQINRARRMTYMRTDISEKTLFTSA
jgi:hypothetical protein